ncbi:MAG: PspC domain-containing protein [Actinomycetota bacterium]
MNDTSTSPRRLYRSMDDRKVAGVGGGLGDYFGVDPVLFRLGFVLGTVFGGVGLLAYVIAWLVLPERSGTRAATADDDDADRHWGGPAVIGAILVVVGILTLLDSSSWFGFGVDGPELFWPLALVGGGAWLLLRERTGSGAVADPVTGPAPTTPDGALVPDAPGSDLEPIAGTALAPFTGLGDDDGATPTTPDPAPTAVEVGPSRPSVVRLTLGVLLVYFGVVALGGLFDWWDVDAATVLAVGLLITGVGLVASAFLNRRGWPLLLVGLVFGMALVPATVIDVPLNAGAGEERIPISTPEAVDDRYEYGFGQFVIDGRELGEQLAPGEVLEIEAELGAGQLQIVVPDDVVLDVEIEAGIGEALVELPSRELVRTSDGWNAGIDDVVGPADTDEATIDDPAVLRVDARVGFGQVVIADLPE